ncbi:MAG: EAL domain-containing protein [Gammaproteobacteria bacterium]|nr:EAL domain-containing protein [Gammaproteobacteria bacterium]
MLRLLLRPSLLAVAAVGIALIVYALTVIVPLVDEVRHALVSQEENTRAVIVGPASLALRINEPEESARIAVEISRAPLIDGIVISNDKNRVIAGAWQGDVMTEKDAVDTILEGNMTRWRIDDGVGRQGVVFVAFDDAWPERLESRLAMAFAVLGAGILVFALFVSISIRDFLSRAVRALQRAAAAVAGGDYQVKVPVDGKGPFADLARHFNKMVADLDASTRALRTSEERFQLAVSGSNEAIWDWDLQSDRLYLSPRYAELVGLTEAEVPAMFATWRSTVHPEDQARFSHALNNHIHHGATFHCEFRVVMRDGGWRWMLGRGTVLRDGTSAPVRMVGSFADHSEQKATRVQLEREKERAQVTLKSIADAVITTDRSGHITYMNPAAENVTGWSRRTALLRPIDAVLDFVDDTGTASIVEQLTTGLAEDPKARDLGQTELISQLGETHIVEIDIAPLRDRHDRFVGGVTVIHDITERYNLMRQLSHQAIHDPLTQLINRTGFEDRLNQLLKSAAAHEQTVHAICYMDMDQFKTVNDTCGHAAGDELLRQVSQQLQKHIRKGDTLARLGGDEFGLLLRHCPVEKANTIAEKIRRAIESFRFSWEGKTFSVGLSIGLAPFDGSPGSSAADLLSAVDQACYIAKSKGRNRIHIHHPGDMESSRWHKEIQWVPHIHQAMDEGNFVLLAQPIIDLNGEPGQAHQHYEILLRMRSSNGDLISPGSFLPAAERYNLMGTLDRWVVNHAIEMLAMASVRNPQLANMTFGINISGAVLSDNTLLDHVKVMLNAYRLPPEIFCFEITETVAIANFTHATRFVRDLKEIGCSFALDDFGSGFASFSYLKTLPVDYLKIDGSFVRHLADNEVDHTMVDIINQLGHVMGLRTIAEFVENDRILAILRRIGVDFAQGYHFGQPRPLSEVLYGHPGTQTLPAAADTADTPRVVTSTRA